MKNRDEQVVRDLSLEQLSSFDVASEARTALKGDECPDIPACHFLDGRDRFVNDFTLVGRAHEAPDDRVFPKEEQEASNFRLKNDDDGQHEDLIEIAKDGTEHRHVRDLHHHLDEKQRRQAEGNLYSDRASHQPIKLIKKIRYEADLDDVANPEAKDFEEGHGRNEPSAGKR